MAYSRSVPFNDLPNLPPLDFVESPEILKHLVRASRYLGELNGNFSKIKLHFLPGNYF